MVRILVIVLGIFLGLCVVCAGVGYFVGLPRVRDELQEDMEVAIASYVAPNIAGPDVTPTAGTYTLTEADVNQEIQAGDANLEDFVIDITPEYIEMEFGQQSQSVTYRAGVAVENGELVVTDPSMDGVPDWLLPADTISDGIENGINSYLVDNNMVLAGVTLGEGEMTFVLEEAAG